MWRLAVILALVLTSIAWLYILVVNLTFFVPGAKNTDEFSKFPSSIEDLKSLTNLMPSLIKDNVGFAYVLTLFSSAYVFKQTFAIPGSVFLNLLAGAIFGLEVGFPLTCFLTACGATFCCLLAKFAGRTVAFKYFPQRVEQFSAMLEENESRLPYLLLSLRLFPMSPNWAVNMCCGVLDVPVVTFFFTVFLGLMPYNYICVTTGVILSKLTSVSDVFTWTTMMQLTGVALFAILPAFFVDKKKSH